MLLAVSFPFVLTSSTAKESSADQVSITTSLNIASESWMALDALTLVTLSIYNCKVFGYHAGILKLTALMKGIVAMLHLAPLMFLFAVCICL